MEVRAKKALGQHFLTDLSIARAIAEALEVDEGAVMPTLEVGPGMGVLTQYLLERSDIDLRMVEVDSESIDYLLAHFPQVNGKLMEADFLKLKLENFFPDQFCVIGNFPYNISSKSLIIRSRFHKWWVWCRKRWRSVLHPLRGKRLTASFRYCFRRGTISSTFSP